MQLVTLYSYKSGSVCGSQDSCISYVLKVFLVFNKKRLIKPIKPYKQVQLFFYIYIKWMVIHGINQIVNPNKWEWNGCQEMLQPIWLSCGITPEKPKRIPSFISFHHWALLHNSFFRKSPPIFFPLLCSADTARDKYILLLVSIRTQHL